MSTRATISFKEDGRLASCIYKHSDGYPDGEHGMLNDFDRFFAAVKEQCNGDTRFNDATYLAAKYVVWLASPDADRPLCFSGVGVVTKASDIGDAEYDYVLDCSGPLPTVTYRKARRG
jgi:hypothetical protein